MHPDDERKLFSRPFPEARAEIVGPTLKYLTPGSTLKLICKVLQSTEATAYIFWYHDNRMINYDLDRGINVSSEAGKQSFMTANGSLSKFLPLFALKIQSSRADFHYSELTILHTTKNHSGNYTCVPSNSQPASVVVHIFKGECITVFIKSYNINKSKTSRKLAKFFSLSAESILLWNFCTSRLGMGSAECFSARKQAALPAPALKTCENDVYTSLSYSNNHSWVKSKKIK